MGRGAVSNRTANGLISPGTASGSRARGWTSAWSWCSSSVAPYPPASRASAGPARPGLRRRTPRGDPAAGQAHDLGEAGVAAGQGAEAHPGTGVGRHAGGQLGVVGEQVPVTTRRRAPANRGRRHGPRAARARCCGTAPAGASSPDGGAGRGGRGEATGASQGPSGRGRRPGRPTDQIGGTGCRPRRGSVGDHPASAPPGLVVLPRTYCPSRTAPHALPLTYCCAAPRGRRRRRWGRPAAATRSRPG